MFQEGEKASLGAVGYCPPLPPPSLLLLFHLEVLAALVERSHLGKLRHGMASSP